MKRSTIAVRSLFAFSALVLSASQSAHANRVQAAVEGTLLKVYGDSRANGVEIEHLGNDDVVVRGFNGTLINGRASVTFPAVVLEKVDARTGGGNDRLVLIGIRPSNDVFVDLGAGNDTLTTPTPADVGGNLTIEGGAGTDSISLLDPLVGQDVAINGGLGVLTLNVTGLIGGKGLHVVSDQSNDSITVTDTTTADVVSIETKGGADVVSLSLISVYALQIATDVGTDSVTVEDAIVAEDLGIFSGTENDAVSLTNVASDKSLTVSVDAGADQVYGEVVSAAEDAVFEGGAGTDTIVDLGITGGKKKDIKEFESLLP